MRVEILPYSYSVYGQVTIKNASGTVLNATAYANRFLFTGGEYVAQLGLYDLRCRFYSPTLGRFLQTDPTGHNGDGYNLYRYCANNPSNLVDPSGKRPIARNRLFTMQAEDGGSTGGLAGASADVSGLLAMAGSSSGGADSPYYDPALGEGDGITPDGSGYASLAPFGISGYAPGDTPVVVTIMQTSGLDNSNSGGTLSIGGFQTPPSLSGDLSNNLTLFQGVSATAGASGFGLIGGYTIGLGSFQSSDGWGGIYLTYGPISSGFAAGAGFDLGYTTTDSSIFAGPYTNYNLTVEGGVTWLTDPLTGKDLGEGYSFGPSIPSASVSVTQTNTIILPVPITDLMIGPLISGF